MTPLTDEQVAEIAARHQNALDYGPWHPALDDVGALLVDRARLVADLAAWKSAAKWRGASDRAVQP